MRAWTFQAKTAVLAVMMALCVAEAVMGGTNMLQGVRRIVFVGDSLTDGAAWTGWVMSTLVANGYPDLVMHDAAVAGNKIGMVRARFTNDVLSLKPDLVVLGIGTNDKLSAEEYRSDLESLVIAVRSRGARMLLMAPPLVRDAAKEAYVRSYGEVARELAAKHGCGFADLHAAFEAAQEAGSELLGPDGVHHRIDGWRTMGRSVLDALGCHVPMVEQVALAPRALTEWYIGPAVPWKLGQPHPPLPELRAGFDPVSAKWRKFDRTAEIARTSWWQVSWLERGGIMPMGQDAVAGSPGAASRESGAFSLAIVPCDRETRTTLHVGGAMGYAVWLNGELVWDGKTNHGYHPDADRFPVTLRAGENQILVFSNWLFYVALGEY